MKLIRAVIDSIMIHEGKKTLSFIDKQSQKQKPNLKKLRFCGICVTVNKV